jgi:excinuclease UvrABC ATPase subunit
MVGKVIAQGPPSKIIKSPDSWTGKYLSGKFKYFALNKGEGLKTNG